MRSPRGSFGAGRGLLALGMAVAAAGCQAQKPRPSIAWELAHPVDLGPQPAWQLRLADGQVIPANLRESLCDEFDLVLVRSDVEWRRLGRAVGLSEADAGRPNFRRGSVVGLVAKVGQPANDAWPIRVEEVRLAEGSGWVRFAFQAGLYYPIATPPYFTAAFVPGLREVKVVQVGRRIFAVGDSGAAEEPDVMPLRCNTERCIHTTVAVDCCR